MRKDGLYGGKTVFNIDLEGGGGGQMGGLASAFGLGGGNPSGGLLDAANFSEVLTSRTVFEDALMTEIELFGRKDLLINFVVDSSGIKENQWGGGLFYGPSYFADIRYTKKKPGEEFTRDETMAISEIIGMLEKSTVLEPEQGTSLYNLSAKLENELLTKAYIETLLDATERFYTKMRTIRTRRLIAIQEKRVDSLRSVLYRFDNSLARNTYDQPNLVDPLAASKTTKLSRDASYVSSQYATNMASLDNLKNLLVEQAQVFHVLTPVLIPMVSSNKAGISVRLTGLILLFAAIMIISLRKTYLDVMSEEPEN